MKQKEKQLLLKDLCAMLPYGLKGKVETTDGNGNEIKDEGVLNSVFIDEYGKAYICIDGMEYELDGFKPYLRPMQSMTEEEAKDYFKNSEYESSECYETSANCEHVTVKAACSADEACVNTDWLNSHHFDYRGLIERGLALEAPDGMYEIVPRSI